MSRGLSEWAQLRAELGPQGRHWRPIFRPRPCGRNEGEGQGFVSKAVPRALLRDTGIKTNSIFLFYFSFYFLILLHFGNVIIVQHDNSKTIFG